MNHAEWRKDRLDWNVLPAHPMDLFGVWHRAARETEPWHAGAMVLATAGSACGPSARVVLMRGFDACGIRFYTNYESRKGVALAENPKCAVVFWWPSQVRQIRVEGVVQRLPRAESEAYFAGRPRGSQLGAWSSPQSQPIEDVAVLESKYGEIAATFEGQPVACPPHWGGYLLQPQQMEFWQGGKDRLHDRAVYVQHATGWRIERLAP
ncbi:MAG: pyridoxamine 5'-phosphate oxidase [Kiritimatiellia bacterium]